MLHANDSNSPSQLPPPPEKRLEIVPPDPGKEIDVERQVIDRLLENNGVGLPWVRKSWKERGQA